MQPCDGEVEVVGYGTRCRGTESFRVWGFLGSSLRLDEGATLSSVDLQRRASKGQKMTSLKLCRDLTRRVLALEKGEWGWEGR
jgi:hypothetical protein